MGDSIPAARKVSVTRGVNVTLTPRTTAPHTGSAATATSSNAIFAATSDDEHAVSIAIDGPVSANVNDARPGTTLPKLAAAASAEGYH